MPGVDSVAIETEKNLVLVTGAVDAMTLVNKVANLGKKVQLLPSDKHPYNNNHVEEKHQCTRTEGRDNNSTARQKGKMNRNCCCQDGRHGHKKEEEEEHKCEAYVPPKVDERVCRDYYCKVHPKMRKIVDRVPAADSTSSTLFGIGGLPFYTGFGPHTTGSYSYPGWYGEEPPRFGYRRPPPRMLPHPFGFQ
ncbi:hypothetical protein Pfo_015479 [Paulownia fortunei]|nr:hypothetical protein Pfo_015479 [Paulownia fortunei]